MTRKPCPIQPCPERIPGAWVTCDFHWKEYVPPLVRELHARGRREQSHAITTYAIVLALSFVWSFLEQVGLPMPAEHSGYPWQCSCRSCAPILRRAQKHAGVHDPGQWPFIVAKAGMLKPTEVAA